MDAIKDFFMVEKKRIFLIASERHCNFSDNKVLLNNRKYELNENDIVVRFNRCDKIQAKLFNGHYDIRILRGHPPHVSDDYRIHGGINNKTRDNSLFLVQTTTSEKKDKLKEMNNIKHIYNFYPFSYQDLLKLLNVDEKCETNKKPSLGFIGFVHMKHYFPEAKIYLVGYTFTGWKGHDFGLEKNIIKKLDKVNIIAC